MRNAKKQLQIMKHLLLFILICFIGFSATSQKSKQYSPTLTKFEARQIIDQTIKSNSNNAINSFMSQKSYIENDKIIIEANLSTDEFSTYYIDKNYLTFMIASLKNELCSKTNIFRKIFIIKAIIFYNCENLF